MHHIMQTPASQDDILIVTISEAEEHYNEVNEISKFLEETGYRASVKNTELFQIEIDWLGHHIYESGIKPKKSKTDAILAIEKPDRIRDVRSFLGLVQYLGKFIPHLTDLTKPRMQLTEKTVRKWHWEKNTSKPLTILRKK